MIVNELQPRAGASACALLDGHFGPSQAVGVVADLRGRTMSATGTGAPVGTSRFTAATAAPAHVKAIAVVYPHLQAPPS